MNHKFMHVYHTVSLFCLLSAGYWSYVPWYAGKGRHHCSPESEATQHGASRTGVWWYCHEQCWWSYGGTSWFCRPGIWTCTGKKLVSSYDTQHLFLCGMFVLLTLSIYKLYSNSFIVQKHVNHSFLTFRGLCSVISSYNKSHWDALFLNFILVKNSTCFSQIYCPSSGVLVLYSQQ